LSKHYRPSLRDYTTIIGMVCQLFFTNGLGIDGKITVVAVDLSDIETRRPPPIRGTQTLFQAAP